MIASQVKIKLINANLMGEMYFCEDQLETARALAAKGEYSDAGEFAVEGTGSDAAEEAFDLTNNPSRQAERVQLYGRGRSISVGDIVEVNGVAFLCANVGWRKLA